jgi:hypothetical protein
VSFIDPRRVSPDLERGTVMMPVMKSTDSHRRWNSSPRRSPVWSAEHLRPVARVGDLDREPAFLLVRE